MSNNLQSKMISRATWIEKKHIWKINVQKNGVRKSFYSTIVVDAGLFFIKNYRSYNRPRIPGLVSEFCKQVILW